MRLPPGPWSEAVAEALARIPVPVLEKMGRWNLVAGVDPWFAGLVRSDVEKVASNGRSYAEIAHVLLPWHLDRPAAERVPTIVLPNRASAQAWILVHEF